MPDAWSIAPPGMCLHGVSLSDPCERCLHVYAVIRNGTGIPDDRDATVLVECMNCPAMIEVRTGCRGIDDALSQGWTLDGAGDMNCERCSEARAEILGDET